MVGLANNIPPRTPVTEEVLELVFRRLKMKKPTSQMLGVRKSGKPAELIFLTSEGEVPCQVKEDDIFIIFEMPSGENNLCAPKQEFLKALSGAND